MFNWCFHLALLRKRFDIEDGMASQHCAAIDSVLVRAAEAVATAVQYVVPSEPE